MEIGKDTSGDTLSMWFEHIHRPQFPSLNKDIATDVCIVGAGIAGLTTAYQLINEGKRVIVIDDGRICSGETGRTSAHLTNVLDYRYMDIERAHGRQAAQFTAASHTAAINYIEAVINNEGIACDFERVDGHLYTNDTSKINYLKKEARACQRAGFTQLELLTEAPPQTFKMHYCLLFPQQAQFHPLKYLTKLAKIIKNKGGTLFELTHAKNIKTKNGLSIVTNKNFIIQANQIVIATNTPINNRYVIHTKQEANRTYIISSPIPKDSIKLGLYWDTADPYHYIRVVKNESGDRVIIGGEDHRVAEPPTSYNECFKKLERWAKEHFPHLLSIDLRWSGQIIEPVDYLAFIGHNPFDNENVYITTGTSGNGLTHGTLAGMLISDLILKKENPWTKLYDPTRKSIKTIGRYLKNNLNAATTYLNYLSFSEISTMNKMTHDTGKVINRGLKKIAVYRDKTGNFFECSAICPHLKSILHWNTIEKTWDCPAHGSRFTPTGEVINGPAINGLLPCKAKKESD